ncbi:hypothetical protein MKY04_04170 [Lysinibacillus telephonicus]|uniref:hypothetical protein n=1 Tax=Lysinibacillus telephonicus TaxID=1714840 RepID=UPI0031FD5463
MKNILLLLVLLFVLFGCNDNSKQEETLQFNQQFDEAIELINQNEFQSAKGILTELEETLSSSKEHNDLLKNVQTELHNVEDQIAQNKQLALILLDIYENYGVVSPNHGYHESEYTTGVVYTELIDFNNDAKKELYILFKSNDYQTDEMEHRNQNGYIEEVWGASESDPSLLWDAFYTIDSSTASDLAVTLVKLKNNTTAIKHSSDMTRQGIEYSHNLFFTLQDKTISLTDEFYYALNNNFEEDNFFYGVNGDTVDQQTYEKAFDTYAGEEQPIIKSSIGTKEFAMDLSPISSLENVINTLTTDMGDFANGKEATMTPELEQAITDYSYFGNIDKRDTLTYESMIAYVILHNIVESDAPGEYGAGYTEQTVKNAVKEYFNVDLDPSSLDLPSEFDLENWNWMYYKDGIFQVAASDFYDDVVIRNIEKIVQVTDDLLFAKVNDLNFDYMNHSLNTNLDFDYNPYINKPIEQWPDHAQPYLKRELPTYLLLHQNNNRYQLYYHGNKVITSEEIEEF